MALMASSSSRALAAASGPASRFDGNVSLFAITTEPDDLRGCGLANMLAMAAVVLDFTLV